MDNMLTLQPVINNQALRRITTDRIPTAIVHSQEDNQLSTSKPFIEANTIEATLEDIKQEHIIPVFIKDNEPLINHAEFIELTSSVTADVFHGETILKPAIRLSHPIKGRIPEAKDKPASQLENWEKTVYFERMAFIIEVPTITDIVGGNQLSLTIGGVKAYNLDNLSNRKGADEHFKLFIGFQNKVCTNQCVWSDGAMLDVKVKNLNQLRACVRTLLENYNQQYHLYHLKELCEHSLTERQFATLIGRCRMYNHLPTQLKSDVPALLFGDTQLGSVCKDYYKDDSFCRDKEGNINLWRLYNLFTNANKSTYIDSFAERSVNAFSFAYNIKQALQGKGFNWYLN